MPGPYAPSDARNYVGFAKQLDRVTGAAPTLFVPYIPSVELDHAQALNRIFEAGAHGMVTDAEKVSHIPTGLLPFLARPKITAQTVAFMLGLDTVTGLGPWTHVITDDAGPNPDYISVEQNLADEAIERFVTAAVAEVVFTCDVDNPKVRTSARWVGGKPAWQGAATAESYETDNPFLISDAAFTVDGDATPENPVRKFTLTVRVRMGIEQVADVTADYLVKAGYEVELEVEQLLLGVNTGYREVHYGSTVGSAHTKSPKSGSFIADFNYGSGAAARGMKLEVPNLDYDTAVYSPLSPDAGEGSKLTLTSQGRKVAGSPLFRYTGITNDSAAYV